MKTIVVVGTGSIGMRHLRILSNFKDVKVFAFPLRSERENILKEAGYHTIRDLTSISSMDGAIIATNTGDHLGNAKDCIRLGADVLIEKPIASTVEGVSEFLAEANVKNKQVYVGCCLRFNQSLLTFRDFLPRIGNIHAVEISCRSYLPDWRPERNFRESYSASNSEGGVLRDLIHEIDYASWLFGFPAQVWGHISKQQRLGISAEEQVILSWETKEGVQVCIQLDYLTRIPVRKMSAYGSLGQLRLNLIESTIHFETPGRPIERVVVPVSRDQMYIDQDNAFVSALYGRKEGYLASGIDGYKALMICDAVRQSSKLGSIQEIQIAC